MSYRNCISTKYNWILYLLTIFFWYAYMYWLGPRQSNFLWLPIRLHMYTQLLIRLPWMFLYFSYNLFSRNKLPTNKTKFCVISWFTNYIFWITLFININSLILRKKKKKGSKYSSTYMYLISNKSQKIILLEWKDVQSKNTLFQWKWS